MQRQSFSFANQPNVGQGADSLGQRPFRLESSHQLDSHASLAMLITRPQATIQNRIQHLGRHRNLVQPQRLQTPARR